MDDGNKIAHSEWVEAGRDSKKTASLAHLTYVTDRCKGISRIRKGKSFQYLFNGKIIKEKDCLDRIKKLVIPPSWSDVWICKNPNGHLQATGLDLRKRKQYRYHPDWNRLRSETKFHHLFEFGKLLPVLRQQVQKDLLRKDLSAEKVVGVVINLMEEAYIRVGNSGYEKTNGSYGLTTLKDKHVKISRNNMLFSFVGKKGITHNITLRNKKLAGIVKQCRDIPGKELFQYYDEKGQRKHIDSGMVNNYLKDAVGMEITAKDFRTWAGSLQAVKSFMQREEPLNAVARKKNILYMLNEVSTKLGNTPTVCKKYYIHPAIISLYEEDKLLPYVKLKKTAKKVFKGLSQEESILMRILEKSI